MKIRNIFLLTMSLFFVLAVSSTALAGYSGWWMSTGDSWAFQIPTTSSVDLSLGIYDGYNLDQGINLTDTSSPYKQFSVIQENGNWHLNVFDSQGSLVDGIALGGSSYFKFFFNDDIVSYEEQPFGAFHLVADNIGGNSVLLGNVAKATATTPIPGAIWLISSGLFGLLGFKRFFC